MKKVFLLLALTLPMLTYSQDRVESIKTSDLPTCVQRIACMDIGPWNVTNHPFKHIFIDTDKVLRVEAQIYNDNDVQSIDITTDGGTIIQNGIIILKCGQSFETNNFDDPNKNRGKLFIYLTD